MYTWRYFCTTYNKHIDGRQKMVMKYDESINNIDNKKYRSKVFSFTTFKNIENIYRHKSTLWVPEYFP